MNEGVIFLLQDDNKTLVPMSSRSYDSEDLLQALLAHYPDLLAGEQMNRNSPRKWLLVRREAGVPSQPLGGDRWSIDHLFLDQDGIPTIVEVKRSSNTQIRREVVGQMLDYAANAVAYWPTEHIQAMFEQSCRDSGQDPIEAISSLLGDEDDTWSYEQFWTRVSTNLQAGKIRMVFVADVVPPELQRIVEFLNSQTVSAEVLAVESVNMSDKEFAPWCQEFLVRPKRLSKESDPHRQACQRRPNSSWLSRDSSLRVSG